MTVELKTESVSKSSVQNWVPKARRHGEAAGWNEPPPALPANDDIVYPSLSATPVQWPRVFPSL